MRFGKSVFLGLVEAELADYPDCARYQILCPVCSEAVHKRVLPRPDGRGTHFFAHYREVPAEDAQRCELRASSITPQQVEAAKAEARGQALAMFEARYAECVMRGIGQWAPRIELDTRAGGGGATGAARVIAKRPEWRTLAEEVRRVHVRTQGRLFSGEDPFEYIRTWAEGKLAAGGHFAALADISKLWRAEIAAHARAMMAHALSPNGRRAYDALFTAAALAEWYQWHARIPQGTPEFGAPANSTGEERRLVYAQAMTELIGAAGGVLRSTISRLRSAPSLFSRAPPTMLMHVTENMVGHMPIILVAVPYEDILRETIGRTERPRRVS